MSPLSLLIVRSSCLHSVFGGGGLRNSKYMQIFGYAYKDIKFMCQESAAKTAAFLP